MEITNSAKRPSLGLSLIPIIVMVILLFFTIHIFGSDALSGGSQVVLPPSLLLGFSHGLLSGQMEKD